MIDLAMTDQESDAQEETGPAHDVLLTDEPTIELVIKAKDGDRMALEALLERCLPALRRWAHGRLPSSARGHLDTEDVVQESALHVVRRLQAFEPRHVGAMQAYLRQSVMNRIRDEIRRVGRRPPPLPILDDHPSDEMSPLETAIQTETYERYREALSHLSVRDRELVVARIEAQWDLKDIASKFEMPSVDAARMAVSRALKRLTTQLNTSRPADQA